MTDEPVSAKSVRIMEELQKRSADPLSQLKYLDWMIRVIALDSWQAGKDGQDMGEFVKEYGV